MTVNEVAQRCKSVLESRYGFRLEGLVLYGSAARDRASSASDIDLLILLRKPFDYSYELLRVIEFLHAIQLESERIIPAKPAAADEFECGSIQLYRNARREGLLLRRQHAAGIAANLERAEASLRAAKELTSGGYDDLAASRAYYAALYAATATFFLRAD
jgi:predicted nucleotidyltransferase